MPRRTFVAAIIGASVVAGCSSGAGTREAGSGRPSATAPKLASGAAASLVPLAPAKLALCRRSPRLRAICPRVVPLVRAPYLSHLADGEPAAVFDLERGVPGQPPPRSAHMTLVAGDVESADPFQHPRAADATSSLSDSLLNKKRVKAISFGRAMWGGHDGVLFLAPPFLYGGQLGDHLVFEWTRDGRRFVFSLHAWKPLADTAATLRALVEAAS